MPMIPASTTIASEVQIQRAYEDEAVASSYIDVRFKSELNRLLHERQVDAVQRAIDQARPERILEIAPGPGRITRHIRSNGQLVCLEFNDSMIEQGRQATSQVIWVRGNAFRLPFSQQFDLAYSFRFVRHFHRRDRERLYQEIRRVLRPGGLFLLDAVNDRFSRPLREARPEEYPIYDKLYREDELRAELGSAGLRCLSILPVKKFHGWQSQSQVLLGPRINWLNRYIIRALECLPRHAGLEWIVKCRCE